MRAGGRAPPGARPLRFAAVPALATSHRPASNCVANKRVGPFGSLPWTACAGGGKQDRRPIHRGQAREASIMNAPAIRRPSLRPPKLPRAAPPEAAFTIDAAAGLLLAADAAGWTAWGIDAACAPPVAVDGAMPALQTLRNLAASGAGGGGPCTLTVWTARGLARWRCRVEFVPASGGGFRCLPCRCWATPTTRTSLRARTRARGRRWRCTAWLAHELRTPLSAVIAYAEILKDEHFGPLADARYRSYANDIYDSARHALGVVDGMLRGEPQRSGVPPLAFADLDPAGVVESCLTVARPLAEQAGLDARRGRCAAPAAHHRRRAEPEADAAQPARQRHQVRAPRRPGDGLRWPTRPTVRSHLGRRYRPRHGRGRARRQRPRHGPPMRGWASACR